MTQQGPEINQLGANMAGFFSNIDSIAVSLFVDILIDLLTNISDGDTDIETRCLVYFNIFRIERPGPRLECSRPDCPLDLRRSVLMMMITIIIRVSYYLQDTTLDKRANPHSHSPPEMSST